MEVAFWIFAVGIGLIVWAVIAWPKFNERMRAAYIDQEVRKADAVIARAVAETVQLAGSVKPLFNISGESHYQAALESIAGIDDDGVEHECEAVLVPDVMNAFDENAVAVTILGRIVGYLPRGRARLYRERMAQLDLDPRSAACRALICGGFVDEDGDRAHYGVKLYLAWPVQVAAA